MSVCLTEKKLTIRSSQNNHNNSNSKDNQHDLLLIESSNAPCFLKQSMKNTNSCEKATKQNATQNSLKKASKRVNKAHQQTGVNASSIDFYPNGAHQSSTATDRMIDSIASVMLRQSKNNNNATSQNENPNIINKTNAEEDTENNNENVKKNNFLQNSSA